MKAVWTHNRLTMCNMAVYVRSRDCLHAEMLATFAREFNLCRAEARDSRPQTMSSIDLHIGCHIAVDVILFSVSILIFPYLFEKKPNDFTHNFQKKTCSFFPYFCFLNKVKGAGRGK